MRTALAPAPGMGANHILYTDVQPYEVISVISEKTIEIRAMKATLDKAATGDMGFTPGGFVGHYSDQHKQVWVIESDPEAPVLRARLHKDGYWKVKDKWGGYTRHRIEEKPRKFHDYNF